MTRNAEIVGLLDPILVNTVFRGTSIKQIRMSATEGQPL